MIEILYDRDRKMFVAREHNGNIIRESTNFNRVDIAANKAGGDVVYKIQDFPKWAKDKINGVNSNKLNARVAYTESFKSVFQSIIMSLYRESPPDETIRRVVRKMLKKKMHHLDTIYAGEKIYIIAGRQSKVLAFKFWKADAGVWKYRAENYDRLPSNIKAKVDRVLSSRYEQSKSRKFEKFGKI